MNKKGIWLGAVIILVALALIPCVAKAEITEPELNRTYPYSTHLVFETYDVPASLTSCNLTLTWAGDASGHGDDTFPKHTLPPLDVDCDSANLGTYSFDVDFDGLYYANFSQGNATEWHTNVTSFFVDRSEVQGSKVIGAILYPIILLIVCGLLYKMGSSIDEKHWVMAILYSMTALIIMPFAVHISFLVINEYIKIPVLSQSYETILMILLFGILFVTGAYLLIQFIVKLVKILAGLRSKRRGDPQDDEE